MRGAIIISGEMRRWENCVETVNLLSEFCDLDVFIHAWDQITGKVPGGWGKNESFSVVIEKVELNIKEDNLDHKELIKQIKPKGILIESKDALDPYIELMKEKYTGKPWTEKRIENFSKRVKYTNQVCLGQFYSARKSYDVYSKYSKENNIEYDFIIKSRSDIKIKIPNKKNQEKWWEQRFAKPLEDPDYMLRAPWILIIDVRTQMDYAVFFGKPKAFEAFFKDFPECLEGWISSFGGDGCGGKHDIIADHFLKRGIDVKGPIPFPYQLVNPKETGDTVGTRLLPCGSNDGEVIEEPIRHKK